MKLVENLDYEELRLRLKNQLNAILSNPLVAHVSIMTWDDVEELEEMTNDPEITEEILMNSVCVNSDDLMN